MAFSTNLKCRCWVVTIHIENMKKAGLSEEEYKDPEILALTFLAKWESSGKGRTAGISICESAEGCYHAHMACYGNSTTLKNVSKILCDSHTEPQLGGKEQLTAYLLKEGKYAEKGEKVLYTQGLEYIQDNQGNRSDINEIEELIELGATPRQIFEKNFRYRKYEKMIHGAFLDKRIKDTPLEKKMWNEYHWGKSGSGKTFTYIFTTLLRHIIRKKCFSHRKNIENHYYCRKYPFTAFDIPPAPIRQGRG